LIYLKATQIPTT